MVEVPLEIRSAIKALRDDTRFEMLLRLSEEGEMSFSQLESTMNMSSSNLTYHLQELREGALIENFFKRVEDVDRHSFYRVTDFGERFIDSLFRILAPGAILVEYTRAYERETTIKERWIEEMRYTKLPSRSLPEGAEYEKITVERAEE